MTCKENEVSRLDQIEERAHDLPAEVLVPVEGQHPTLTALAATAGDVPWLIARVRELESRIAFVQEELGSALRDDH